MYSKLSDSQIFKGINSGEVVHILNQTHHQIKTFDAENIIALSGHSCINLYILIEGSVRGEIVDFKGKTIKIEDVYAPDTFTEAFLFATENNLLVNVIANTKVKVLIIFREDLLNLFQTNKIILTNYLNVVSDRFITVTQKMKFLSLKTIKGKLANYFLFLIKKNNNIEFKLLKTQEQLAEYFGVTRPALAREFNCMKKEKIISIKNKKITILNKQKLKQLIS